MLFLFSFFLVVKKGSPPVACCCSTHRRVTPRPPNAGSPSQLRLGPWRAAGLQARGQRGWGRRRCRSGVSATADVRGGMVRERASALRCFRNRHLNFHSFFCVVVLAPHRAALWQMPLSAAPLRLCSDAIALWRS